MDKKKTGKVKPPFDLTGKTGLRESTQIFGIFVGLLFDCLCPVTVLTLLHCPHCAPPAHLTSQLQTPVYLTANQTPT